MPTPDHDPAASVSPTPTSSPRPRGDAAPSDYECRLTGVTLTAVRQTLARAGRRDLADALAVACVVPAPRACVCHDGDVSPGVPPTIYVVQYCSGGIPYEPDLFLGVAAAGQCMLRIADEEALSVDRDDAPLQRDEVSRGQVAYLSDAEGDREVRLFAVPYPCRRAAMADPA